LLQVLLLGFTHKYFFLMLWEVLGINTIPPMYVLQKLEIVGRNRDANPLCSN
jgi:hypothetical protein